MGMLLSLAIAFVVTPWLSRLWFKAPHAVADATILFTRNLSVR